MFSTCFFHLAQAHWRKIQSLDLVEHYISDEEYSLLLRCFTALAFVPDTRVAEYFNLISQSVPEDAPPIAFDFVKDIEDTHVGRELYERAEENENEGLMIRNRRTPRWKKPIFAPKLWSVYERVLNDEPKTTNMLEGWLRRLVTLVAKHHPYIYDIIGCLRSEQTKTDTVISKLLIRDAPAGMRKGRKSKDPET